MPLFHLVYCSTAASPLGEQELGDLLTQSRSRNASLQVTGLLVYHQGGFMQVLEGEEQDVQAIFASIRKDRRHFDIVVLVAEPASRRDFGEWHMAFRTLRKSADLPEGFSHFLNTSWSGREFSDEPGITQHLLLSFKKHLR